MDLSPSTTPLCQCHQREILWNAWELVEPWYSNQLYTFIPWTSPPPLLHLQSTAPMVTQMEEGGVTVTVDGQESGVIKQRPGKTMKRTLQVSAAYMHVYLSLHTALLASYPRLTPAFRRLQYGKAGSQTKVGKPGFIIEIKVYTKYRLEYSWVGTE